MSSSLSEEAKVFEKWWNGRHPIGNVSYSVWWGGFSSSINIIIRDHVW